MVLSVFRIIYFCVLAAGISLAGVACSGGGGGGGSSSSQTTTAPAPSPVKILSPTSNPYSSNSSNFTVSGTCATGMAVTLSGGVTASDVTVPSHSLSETCTSSAFSFTIVKSVDGTYNLNLVQTNTQNGKSSTAVLVSWVRNTQPPSQPTILNPPTNPYSSSTDISISGGCQTGSTINLTGSSTQSVVCTGSAYSFNVTEPIGMYNFSLTATDTLGNVSGAAALQWTKDPVMVPTPTMTSPASNPFSSNTPSLTISGGCITGDTVNLSGASTQAVTCDANASFTFTVNESVDGTYNFSMTQNDSGGNVSPAIALQWTRDTTPPSVPTIVSPAVNPYDSNTANLTISGGCETGSTVNLAGSSNQSATCVASAYSFAVNQAADGTYNFTLSATDSVGNTSGSVSLQWVKNSSAPSAPTISAPSSNPVYTNTSSIMISGTCSSGDTVNLSGDSTQSTACVSSSYSFTVNESVDSTYNFNVSQTDSFGNISASVSQQWVRVTTTPMTPTIVTPSVNPYQSNGSSITISGACLNGTTISMVGDSLQSVACSSSAYSFVVNESVDNTYNFTLSAVDLAGNVSGTVSQQWVRDTVIPAAPTITSPASNPYYTNTDSVVISGGCVTGDIVSVAGASTDSAVCSASSYSFTVSQTTDSAYNYTLTQSDAAGNVSAATQFQWVRDTVAPLAPTITSPASNPVYTNTNTVTVSGGCETGATVNLSGSSTASTTCSNSAYSLSVSETTDGTYNFAISQTDPAGNVSTSVALQWLRDTVTPAAPTITSTSESVYQSNTSSVTISGACVTGDTVNMSGDSTQSATCTNSSYSFTVSETTDGTYNFSVTESDIYGNVSSATNQQWVRSTMAPASPTITSPASNPYYSNTSSVTISGACATGDTVNLGGISNQTTSCVASAYSFTVNESADGSYGFSLSQTDVYGNTSSPVSFTWSRKTVAPAAPTITIPATNPFTSGDTNLTISGGCATGDTVNLSGASTQSTVCVSSNYSFVVTENVNATYNFSIAQTDIYGNVSGSTSLQWTRDTTIPPTPYYTTPSANPYYTNTSSITISGGCATAGDTIDITGASTQSTACSASNTYSFTVSESVDGSYGFSITETDLAGIVSAPATLTWVRSTSAPSAPTIVTPASNPYTSSGNLMISGGCTTGDTVNLSGSSVQSVSCSSNAYTFTVNQSVDGIYNFSLSQSDAFGNVSSSVSLQWVRNSTVPPTPTITSPATNPVLNNLSSITISGACETNDTVNLTGDSTQSIVCANSSYVFNVTETVDGTYNFSITETNPAQTTSGAATLQWVRYTQLPTVSITSQPAGQNLSSTASFTFSSATSPVTYQCQLDSSGYSSCVSPLSYTSMVNGSHTFSVEAVDQYGNVSMPASYTWTQAAYKTIALYHFDSGTGATTDSSNYSGADSNTLTNFGTSNSSSSCKFGQCENFSSASSNYMGAPNTPTQNLGTSTMTVETWANFASLPTTTPTVLLSKMGASPNMGWEFKMKKVGTKYKLQFSASLNGTSTTVVTSSSCGIAAGTWVHLAVTWNKGTVQFFCNGTASGTATIGTAGSSVIFASTADIQIGKTANMGTNAYFNGILDEVRLSDVVRWSASFTPSTSAYSAD